MDPQQPLTLTRPFRELAALDPETLELAAASVSENTLRSYQGALQRLSDHLGDDVPTDPTLADYLKSLHKAGKSPATASMVMAAVRFLVKLQGIDDPIGPLTKAVLAGLRRKGRSRGRGQVAGIRWSQADTMAVLAAHAGQGLKGLRDAALIAVMSDGMLRVSEAAVLQVEDLAWEEDGTGRLTIRHSKTDQEGKGAVQFLGSPTVKRIRAWTEEAGFTSGPLFRRVRAGDVLTAAPLSHRSIREVVRRWAAAADLEGRVSGHSLRVGSAQSLAKRGASVVEMQTEGRWQSPSMPGHYARGQLAGQGATARYRYGDRPGNGNS